jgi:hypothetical protein
LFLGGQHTPILGGQYAPILGGHFNPELGGQFERFFQYIYRRISNESLTASKRQPKYYFENK